MCMVYIDNIYCDEYHMVEEICKEVKRMDKWKWIKTTALFFLFKKY